MANADSPIGLRAIRHRNGAPYSGSGSLYHVAVGDAQVIAPGDPVIVTGTADANGIPTVTRATAGSTNRITGVMISKTPGEGDLLQDTPLNTVTLTSQYILVEDNPDVVFEVQCDGAFAVTDISDNANLTSAAAVAGKSQWEVDSTSFAVGATLQVRVLRIVRRLDNEVGVNASLEVMINLHTQSTGVGSLGISV